MSDTIAAGQLRAFVERIERLEAEIKEMNGDKSEIYKEARGVGFDVKAIRKCVAKRKLDDDDRQEQDAIFDMYWEALTGSSRVHVHEEPQNSRETASGRLSVATSSEPHGMEDAGGDSVERHATKSHSLPTSSSVTNNAGEVVPPLASPAPISDDVPTFLLKGRKPLRPLCLNPSECAGYGSHTCHRCLKAAGEVAA